MDWLRDLCQTFVKYTFGGGIFQSAANMLTMNPSTGDFAPVWKIITGIYDNVCVPIGMGLVLIYFVVNVIEKSTQQQTIDVEQIIKLLLRLFIGLYFVEHGLELLASVYSLGLNFVQTVFGNTVNDPKMISAETAWAMLTGEKWDESWGFGDIFKGIGVLIFSFIPFILFWIMNAIVTIICYLRLMEFYVRTAMAPIAFSDFFTEGLHGNGWRYFKSYIAVALQGGVIMLVLVICGALSSAILPEYLNITEIEGINQFLGTTAYMFQYILYVLKLVVVYCSAIGLMLKSLSLTKEIVGAN